MPSTGKKLSNDSKYSWVAPGPPCSRSNFIFGLLPIRFVQTLYFPSTVISLTPPAFTPVSGSFRYSASGFSGVFDCSVLQVEKRPSHKIRIRGLYMVFTFEH